MPFPFYEEETDQLKEYLCQHYEQSTVDRIRINDHQRDEMDTDVWNIDVELRGGLVTFIITNMARPAMQRLLAETPWACGIALNTFVIPILVIQKQRIGELVAKFRLLDAEENVGATHYKALRAAASLEQFTHHLDQFEIEYGPWDYDLL